MENLELNIIGGVYSQENIRKKFMAGDRTFIKRDVEWLYILAEKTKLGLSELLRLRYKDFDFTKNQIRVNKRAITISQNTSRGLKNYLAEVKGRLNNEKVFCTYFKNIQTAKAFVMSKQKKASNYRYAQNQEVLKT